MSQFTYTIKDELGIHARPAGLLAKLAKTFGDTVVTVTKGDKTAKASQLMKLMSLGVKKGDEVTIAADGPAADAAVAALKKFFEENL
ncbi:MAG: HPr family phosphocarrier protein [Candidatus Onthomonas sp.]|nr:HPr family phosphocarrier protein [Candidatus Onthomonas sp.]